MIFLKIVGILLLTLALLLLLLLIIEQSLVSLPFTFFNKLFVRNPPFVDKEKIFPESRELEAHYAEIKEEVEQIIRDHMKEIPTFHEVDKIQKPISANDQIPWRVFVLKAYNHWAEENCKLAPKTTELLKNKPVITTAMFSILEPGKVIPPHRGLYNGIYRYHLGLIVPKTGDCHIINGGVKYNWVEGEGVLFDDTYRHQVHNDSQEVRVVLFCDILREDLGLFNSLNRWVFNLRVNSKRLQTALARV